MAISIPFIQSSTGVIFSTYLALHLTNHLFTHFGPNVYDTVMSYLRLYYRIVPVEILLIGSAFLHEVVGLFVIFRRWHRARLTGFGTSVLNLIHPNSKKRLHVFAGWVLCVLFPTHVFSSRIATLLFGDPQHSFQHVGFSFFFWPVFKLYLGIMAAAGFYHMVTGLLQIMGKFSLMDRVSAKFSTSVGVALLLYAITAVGKFPDYAQFYEIYQHNKLKDISIRFNLCSYSFFEGAQFCYVIQDSSLLLRMAEKAGE